MRETDREKFEFHYSLFFFFEPFFFILGGLFENVK